MTADRSTPRPWTYRESTGGNIVVESVSEQVAHVTGSAKNESSKADARLIVRAVNAHEAMREALATIRNLTDGRPVDADRRDRIHAIARAAIALAEKE